MNKLIMLALAPLALVAGPAMAQGTKTVQKTVTTPAGTAIVTKTKIDRGAPAGSHTEVRKVVTAHHSTKQVCKTHWMNGHKMRSCSVNSHRRHS
jgi:hypothetical protein